MVAGHGTANQINAQPKRTGSTQSTQVTISSQSGTLNTSNNISSVNGSTISLGQTTGSASLPVIIASDQSSLITQPNVSFFVSGSTSTTGATSVNVLPGVSSKHVYATAFTLGNSSATAVLVNFQDGSGGTVLWSGILAAGSTISLGSTNPLFKTTAGNGLFFQSSGAVTTLYVSVAGFVL